MKKILSGFLSAAIVVSTISSMTVTVFGYDWSCSDHNTYIANGIEYDKATNQPVGGEHQAYCPFYQAFLASLVPEEPTEEEIVDDVETDIEEDIKLPEEKVEEEIEDEKVKEEIKEEVDEKIEEEKPEKEKIEEDKTEEKVEDKKDKEDKKEDEVKPTLKLDPDYLADTAKYPMEINKEGYTGDITRAMLKDNFVTSNWNVFTISQNPFTLGECTYFAWSRFYQVYGYDNGARGCGKYNAAEIVRAHSDAFELTDTPRTGAVYSIEKNTLYPSAGHVGFIEAYDGENIWISEGNVQIGKSHGNIWIHKVKWENFRKAFPDVKFASPKKPSPLAIKILGEKIPNKLTIRKENLIRIRRP